MEDMEMEMEDSELERRREYEETVERMRKAEEELRCLRRKINHALTSDKYKLCRSVFVGNVDFGCTVEELKAHFESCGLIDRITILSDSHGKSKGYAYIEFGTTEGVTNALHLNGSQLYSRQLKVSVKRNNIPCSFFFRKSAPKPSFMGLFRRGFMQPSFKRRYTPYIRDTEGFHE